MLRILFIFALSMSLPRQGVTFYRFGQCDRMTFSDALPVQFWLQECETFNEHEAQGVHHVCWCQPWNCDDTTEIQFTDTQDLPYRLIYVSEIGERLYSIDFTKINIGGGVFKYYTVLEFTSMSPDICNQKIKLEIVIGQYPGMSAFVNNTDPFYPGETWNTGAAPSVTLGAAQVSKFLWAPIENIVDTVSYTIHYNISIASFRASEVFVSFLKDGNEIVANSTIGTLTGASNIGTLTITGAVDSNYIGFFISDQTPGGSGGAPATYTINSYSIDELDSEEIKAKSDCLDVQESHDETILIEYSNTRNFAGLIYTNDSPDTLFNLRVPCRFFHEVEPEEDDAMELTSSILTTSSQVKTQRWLEVKHVPYYFHKKLRRVLKHQVLNIFDKAWKKEEKYEVNEGRKTWPLKSATCLLTEKNSVVRNIL